MRMLSQRRGGYVDKSIRHAPPKLKGYLKLKKRYVTLELSFAVTIASILFYEDSPAWARTTDRHVNSVLLYQLSYRGITFCSRTSTPFGCDSRERPEGLSTKQSRA